MLIATWNVNSLNARMPRVDDWLQRFSPDVLCLQETKLTNEAFASDYEPVFSKLGYKSVHHGQKQWNGVAILSRVGLKNTMRGFDDGAEEDPDARMVWAECGGIMVGSVYVPNGREVGHSHYEYKLDWLRRLREKIQFWTKQGKKKSLMVLGDFNVAPADMDVWDIKAFKGSTHVSKKEREAWHALCDEAGLTDIFRLQYGDEPGLYTYWDYQGGSFYKKMGMRIDHILTSTDMTKKMLWIVVDRNARKGEKPSDHAPVMAQFREAAK